MGRTIEGKAVILRNPLYRIPLCQLVQKQFKKSMTANSRMVLGIFIVGISKGQCFTFSLIFLVKLEQNLHNKFHTSSLGPQEQRWQSKIYIFKSYTLSTVILLNAACKTLKFWIYSCSSLVLNLTFFSWTQSEKQKNRIIKSKCIKSGLPQLLVGGGYDQKMQ